MHRRGGIGGCGESRSPISGECCRRRSGCVPGRRAAVALDVEHAPVGTMVMRLAAHSRASSFGGRPSRRRGTRNSGRRRASVLAAQLAPTQMREKRVIVPAQVDWADELAGKALVVPCA